MKTSIVQAVLAGTIILIGAPAFADSCSSRTDICNNTCFHRTGDAASKCFLYCKNEKRACLKTGLFRTTGGNYPGLDRH
jgi:hypothetical protein